MYKSWVYACVTAISDSVVALNYSLKDGKWNMLDHEYLKLITPDLLEAIVSFTKLGGSAYIRKVTLGTKIVALKVLRPDTMKIKKNKVGDVVGYEMQTNWKVVKFDKDDIMMVSNFDPMLSGRWYSEVQAAAITMQLDQSSEIRNHSRFTNAANVWTTLTTPDAVDENTRARLEAQREAKNRGANNAHKLAILSGGLQYSPVKPGQKEMDFVNSQRRNMDKILAIYKVPRAIIGMGEGVNVWNVKAFEYIFARRTILPLVNKISTMLNQHVFKDIGAFGFDNVIPQDDVETRSHYLAGAYMLNEYRWVLGLPKDQNGDVYVDGTEWNIEENNAKMALPRKEFVEKQQKVEKMSDVITKALDATVEWTEAYYEKRIKSKNTRLDKAQKAYEKVLKRIFLLQRDDIMKQISAKKSTNKGTPSLDTKYMALYISLLKAPQKELIQQEWDIAIKEIDPDWVFNVMTPEMTTRQKANITMLAKSIDGTTDKKIKAVIKAGLDGWLAQADITSAVDGVFTDLTKKRLDIIVNTESARIATKSQVKAREQTGLVTKKEWYTALDQRVCNYCWPMHGKAVDLKENFFTKWDQYTGSDGKTVTLDYDDVHWAPLHVGCRCDLIPVMV